MCPHLQPHRGNKSISTVIFPEHLRMLIFYNIYLQFKSLVVKKKHTVQDKKHKEIDWRRHPVLFKRKYEFILNNFPGACYIFTSIFANKRVCFRLCTFPTKGPRTGFAETQLYTISWHYLLEIKCVWGFLNT